MIERLEKAKTWGARFIAAAVIVAAVSKDHVFEIATPPAAITGQSLYPNGPKKTVGRAEGTKKRLEPYPSSAEDALYILGLIFIYALLEMGMDASIVRSRTIRRIIMGKTDVEDYWLNIVFQSDQIVGGGLIQISYDDGEYQLSGKDFDSDKIWRGWFETEVSAYAGANLSYKYRALRPGKLDDGTGHGEYNFMGGKGARLDHFYGHFYEDRDNKRFYVYGERLSLYVTTRSGRARNLHPARVPTLVAQFIKDRQRVLPIPQNNPDADQGVLPFPHIVAGQSGKAALQA